MALDTPGEPPPSESGFYPGEVPLHASRLSTRSAWLRPNILWAAAGAVGGYVLRLLARRRHRGRLPRRGQQRREQRRRRARPRLRGRRLARRGSARSRTRSSSSSGASPRRSVPDAQLDAVLQDDRRPQGRRAAVHDRRAHLLLHRRPLRDGDPHRAAEPDATTSSIRASTSRSSREHGTIMMMMATSVVVGSLRQLARAAHDRLAAHGVPERRGVLVLDLRGRLPRDPDRTLPRRLPDRVDGLRAAADPSRRRAWTPTSSASPSSASG